MRAWLTPQSPAGTTVVAVLRVPDSPEARAQLRGFLVDCASAACYEQLAGGLSPSDAAAEWQQALEDWLGRIGCDDV
jgi:hypothetical protein